jgi:hypothetical protein
VRRPPGASLVSALLVAVIALVLVMTLAGVSFTHLNVAARLSNAQQARNLAEAVVARGVEKVLTSQGSWGRSGSAAEKSLEISFSSVPGSRGRLTFDVGQAAEWNIPWSTHNLKEDTACQGWSSRVVPSQAVHFVGTGTCNGVTRRVEAILHIPTYKYAITSSGAVTVRGGMLVAGAEEAQEVLPSVREKLDELLPGHIASNGTGEKAMDLRATSDTDRIEITGDARACGGIELGPFASVLGEVKPQASAVEVPRLDVRDYDPLNFTGRPMDVPQEIPPVLTLEGLVRHKGDLTFQELRFTSGTTGAVLWVDGDITIREKITGTGAIFATGDIKVEGIGALDTDAVVALAAEGDVTVTGNGRDASFFQGLLYSGGHLSLNNVTVLGTVVTNGEPENSELTLTSANVVHVPEVVEFDFTMPWGAGNGVGGIDIRLADGVDLKDFTSDPDRKFGPDDIGFFDMGSKTYVSLDQAANIAYNKAQSDDDPGNDSMTVQQWKQFLREQFDNTVDRAREDLDKIMDFYAARNDPGQDSGTFHLDPNQFIQFDSKTRIILWREI